MFLGRNIVVVMPAYNVADRIAEAIRSVPDLVDHLVVVDDGSRDGTAAVVRALPQTELGCELRLVRHLQNRGVGAAIATGYAEALRLGADVVEVWRVMPKKRLIGNILLSLLTKITSGYWRSFDSQCGYTAISRRALKALGGGFFARYGYPNDLLARLRTLDARLEEVAVRPVYDGQRSGIRIWTVAYPILFVLLRSLIRRLWQRRLRPLLLGEPASTLRLPAAEAPSLLTAPPP